MSGDPSRRGASVLTLSLLGLEMRPVRVTAVPEPGSAAFHLVGMRDTSAREIRVRMCSALEAQGIHLDTGMTLTFEPAPGGVGLALLDLPVVAAVLGDWPVALGSAAQLAVNLVGIVTAGVLVLWARSWGGRLRRARG